MRRSFVRTCLCAAALLVAGCGHSGAKQPALPPWAKRANALCKVDDRKIRNAEGSASEVVFTAYAASQVIAELNELKKVGLLGRVPESFVAAEQALDILRTQDDIRSIRHADLLFLEAQKDAAAKGVHCSFGAFPLPKAG